MRYPLGRPWCICRRPRSRSTLLLPVMTFMTFPRSFYSISNQSRAASSHPTQSRHQSKAPFQLLPKPPPTRPYINQSACHVRRPDLSPSLVPPITRTTRPAVTPDTSAPPLPLPRCRWLRIATTRCRFFFAAIISSILEARLFVHILTRNSPPPSPYHHLPFTPSFCGHSLPASFRLDPANLPLGYAILAVRTRNQMYHRLPSPPAAAPHPRVQVLFFIVHTCAYCHSFPYPRSLPPALPLSLSPASNPLN